MWPVDKNIPKEFLDMAQPLVQRESVTEREFIDLCLLAIKYIDTGKIPVYTRSNMALYIANLWLCHDNISDRNLLDEIGGQFAEWDQGGTFVIEDEVQKPYWEDVKKWAAEADKKFE